MRNIDRESEDPHEDPLESKDVQGDSTLAMDTDFDLPVVLVVDDEPQILKAVRRLLAAVDCEVRTSANGADAIDLLDEQDIAVLISDQRMPGLSGVALLNYAMKNHRNTVRIMLTGNGDWETAMEAINLGQVFRFVAKPWDHDQFVRVIEDAIGQHELLRSKKRYEKFVREKNQRLRELNDELEERVADRTRELTVRNEEVNHLNEELETSFSSTIKAMLAIMELGDIRIAGHCRSTAKRCKKFGAFLEFDAERIRHLERAALLHWIGLINAPAAMFRKPVDAYDAEDLATWEFHPTLGQQAVAQVSALARAGRLIVNYLRRHDDPYFEANPGETDPDQTSDNVHGFSAEFVETCQVLNICSTFERTRRLEQEVEGLGRAAAIQCGLARIQSGKDSEFEGRLVDKFCSMVAQQTGSRELESKVEVDDLEEGMTLSRPIETGQGVPVAPRDVVVTPELIKRLEGFRDSRGLGLIYIRSD
jgi:response regulator RpfG family c-di-GMP phosphodiesterase